jgi:uncharacterized protein YhhL (DUF1145 family)
VRATTITNESAWGPLLNKTLFPFSPLHYFTRIIIIIIIIIIKIMIVFIREGMLSKEAHN